MKFKNLDRDKLLLKIGVLGIIFFVIIGVAVVLQNQLYQNDLYQISSIIMENIHEKYPELEEEVIKDIFHKDISGHSSQDILQSYGINVENISVTSYGMNFLSRNFLIIFIPTSIFLIVIIIFIWKFVNRQDQKINTINLYTKEILKGNYTLDIHENDESELSILRNQIYDMTIMLKEKNELLLQDKKRTEKLLADISHQLKTPLTSLYLLNDLLYDENLPVEKRKEFLESMNKELIKIDWLIKNVLNLAKLDSKTLHLKQENIDLNKLLQEAKDTFSVLTEINQVTIKIDCDEHIKLNCDKYWTLEAINNLFKNAIEHEAKNIEVKVTENDLFVEISVKDDGEGIDTKDIKHIFERFYKAKNAKSNSLGLGLSFVKSIVENQNVDIRVKSKKGVYTLFIIKFYKVKSI